MAEYFIEKRIQDKLNIALEEQIFYHLAKSNQWKRIEQEIEDKGRDFIRQGQLSIVKELLDKLKKIGIEKPIFYILYGDIAEIQGNWNDAKENYNLAKSQEVEKKVKTEGAIKYGEMIFRKGNVKESLTYFNEAYEFSKKNNLFKEEALALNDIGLVNQCFGNLDVANENLLEALRIQNKIDDKQGIGDTLNNISNIYEDRGDFNNALAKQKESLELREKIGDRNGIGMSFANMAGVYLEMQKKESSLKMYQKCLTIYEDIGSKNGIEVALNGIGRVLEASGKMDEALKKYQESLKISKEIGSQSGIASSLNNIANIYFARRNFKDAYDHIEQAIKIEEEIGNLKAIATCYSNIGHYYLEDPSEKHDKALTFLFKALALYCLVGAKAKIKISESGIIKLRDKIGLIQFKELASRAFEKLPSDSKKYIQLKEFINEPVARIEPKTQRNDPCHCGSGKKFKNCHGK